MLRKLWAGAMPQRVGRHPLQARSASVSFWLEGELDCAAKPYSGVTPGFYHLNRAKYQNAVRGVLVVDIDGSAWLPSDEAAFGFDNIGKCSRQAVPIAGQ